jgi:hypothetical protein
MGVKGVGRGVQMGVSVEVSCVGMQVDTQCGLEGTHIGVEVAHETRVRVSMNATVGKDMEVNDISEGKGKVDNYLPRSSQKKDPPTHVGAREGISNEGREG